MLSEGVLGKIEIAFNISTTACQEENCHFSFFFLCVCVFRAEEVDALMANLEQTNQVSTVFLRTSLIEMFFR